MSRVMASIGVVGLVLARLCLAAPPVPELLLRDTTQLLDQKQQIQQDQPDALVTYLALIARADHALEEPVVSVLQKQRTAPSGDKHDYLSLAPYWWPDPDKPDGLPYIRRDGKVNPETRGDNVDYPAKQTFFATVTTLTLAHYYSGNARYGQKAVEWLETWFVKPETRMNPNLNYAQGVPGRSTGRGFGIIEWCDIDQLLDAALLLQASGALTPESWHAIKSWFETYLHWLQTSENGRFERDTLNNHGTWYDVQVACILLFLDRTDAARALLESVKTKRIAAQIEPDGRQPEELARAKSLSYSTMNLRAFTKLALLGRKVGVDLWNYRTDDGRSIPQAFAFLAPFANGEKPWDHPQLGDLKGGVESLRALMSETERQFNPSTPMHSNRVAW